MRTIKTGLKSLLTVFICLAVAGCEKATEETAEIQPTPEPTSNSLTTTVATNFIMGINGHPLNTYEYNANSSTIAGVNYTTQASMVKAMGMTYYRIDVATDATGKSTNEAKLLDIIAKCAANNIKILPMIYDLCDYNKTKTENYNKAFTQMSGFATKYGQYFDYFELGNEWELFDDLYGTNNNSNGRDSGDYNLPRVKLAEQYVRGMEAGLKSVLPNKKSMVNTAGYLPIYWMDRMFAVAPTIDICGWHLYADMPAAMQTNFNISNIHQYLYNRYQRPIWYTESGYKSKITLTAQQNEDAANIWRETLTTQANADPNVAGVMFFELLDRPQRTDGVTGYNYGEENYGWVKFNNYPGKTSATAWNTWKANPSRYQDWSYKKVGAELVGIDLIVTDITWAPASPHTGNAIVFTATVKNVGAYPTPDGVILGVNFKVDGNSAGCNGSSTASLAPGATRTLTANSCSPSSWTALVGTHSVVANIDDQSRIAEGNETNNTLTKAINVTN